MEINYLRKKILQLIILFSAVLSVYSFNTDDVRIKPDQFAVVTGEKAVLDHNEFIEAALYFSAVEKEQISFYMDRYRETVSGFFLYMEEKGSESLSDREKGELLLEYLHEKVFKEYEKYSTTLDILFDKGLFNCVSSGILYYAAAEAAGLKAEGILTSDHAFCRVITEDGEIDVETTTVYGFNPGEKREFKDSFGKTGFVYTPPGKYSSRKIIGKKDFLALILQNRIAKLQKTGNFKDTVPLSVDRHYVLKTDQSLEDMMNEFKNYCVVLNNRKKYPDALAFLEYVYSEYGHSEILSDTATTLFKNSIIDNLASENITEAYEFFYRYREFPLVFSEAVSEMFFEINEKELYIKIGKGSFSESMDLLELKRKNGEIPDKVYYEYYVYLYSMEIENTANSSGWVSALDIVNKSLEKSDDERLLQLKKAVIYNIGVIYHNRFADFFNIQDFVKAKEIVDEGLKLVPGDKKLLNDLQTLKNMSE